MTETAKPLGAGYEVTLERTFKAPASLVFDCFTDREHMTNWWGPQDCENTIYALDARPGGEISLRMAGHGFDHVMGGEFVEIDRPRRLVFLAKAFKSAQGDWDLINRNTLTFEEKDGVTHMTLHTRVERANGDIVPMALNGMKEGWSQSLVRLQALVAKLAS